MIIDVGAEQLNGIVRAWLKDTLETAESNLASHYVHPDDVKTYKKDIKALKWILAYIGDDE